MLKMHTERVFVEKRFYCYMILTRIGMCYQISVSNFMKIHSAIKWLKSRQTYRHSETNINISAAFNAHVTKNKY